MRILFIFVLTENKINEEFSKISLETDDGNKGNLFCNLVKS